MLPLPIEVLQQIHNHCDIDSRRELQKTLHWPFIRHKLKPVSDIDLIKAKLDTAQVQSIQRRSTGNIVKVTLSWSSVDYNIEIYMHHANWIRIGDRTWRWKGCTTYNTGDRWGGVYERVSLLERNNPRAIAETIYQTMVTDRFERTTDSKQVNRLHETQTSYGNKRRYPYVPAQYDTYIPFEERVLNEGNE